ncbi:hypothetical protein AB3S75_000726 [Citrus x aurantiifolia]
MANYALLRHSLWGLFFIIFILINSAAGPAPAAAINVLPNCFGSCISVQDCNTNCIAKNFKSGACLGLGSDYACC